MYGEISSAPPREFPELEYSDSDYEPTSSESDEETRRKRANHVPWRDIPHPKRFKSAKEEFAGRYKPLDEDTGIVRPKPHKRTPKPSPSQGTSQTGINRSFKRAHPLSSSDDEKETGINRRIVREEPGIRITRTKAEEEIYQDEIKNCPFSIDTESQLDSP